jgi:hypothetical protein
VNVLSQSSSDEDLPTSQPSSTTTPSSAPVAKAEMLATGITIPAFVLIQPPRRPDFHCRRFEVH